MARTSDLKCVIDVFPGLRVNADGYETVVPSFARDASDNLPRAVETADDLTLLDEPNLLNAADEILTQFGDDVEPDNSRIGDRMRAGRIGKRAVPATALNSSEGGEGNQKSALASGAPLMSVGPRPDGPRDSSTAPLLSTYRVVGRSCGKPISSKSERKYMISHARTSRQR